MCQPTDPTIVQVEGALRNRWETYVNTFSSTPITVFRAMLLDALVRACGRNDTVAVAFVASARNVLPFTEIDGEQEIWTDIVGDVERKVEARAEREWATPASISMPDLLFDSPPADEIRILSKDVNPANLKPKFEAAVGPHSNDHNGTQRDTNGNPHWPQDNPHEWVNGIWSANS